MKNIVTITLLIFSILMTSCQNNLELNDLIDLKSSFTLTLTTNNPETGLSSIESEEIKVNSEKWIKIVDFVRNNLEDLQPSPASYLGDIVISQGDFRLIYLKDSNGIVFVFADKKGKLKQYTKNIENGELNFLTE